MLHAGSAYLCPVQFKTLFNGQFQWGSPPGIQSFFKSQKQGPSVWGCTLGAYSLFREFIALLGRTLFKIDGFYASITDGNPDGVYPGTS